ncbi:MAG: hypothetical protein M3R21_08970 [Candidatus Dormibacteraeota bacterium]|nr:hypothetical protein [Candidatus Dormibacteraeota bacterium]
MTGDAERRDSPRHPRLHIRLSPATRAELLRAAAALGLPLSSVARQLIEAQLERKDSAQLADADRRLVGLATLVAAEHAVLMVASVLPEGERRMRELGSQAASAAEDRLALFKESGQ